MAECIYGKGDQPINSTACQIHGTWRPIETAPKDGTRIDLWSPIARCRITSAFWHEGDLGPRWYTKRYCGDYLENIAVATRVSHWMPTPEPPTIP